MTTPNSGPEIPETHVVIGKIGAAHGVRGEVKLYPLSDVPDRFPKLRAVWWFGPRGQSRRLEVTSARPQRDVWLIQFAGISSPEEASRLTHGLLALPKHERGRLPAGQHFVDDIIGLTVEDEAGCCLGQVRAVVQTGANDIYEIDDAGREWLLPVQPGVIVRVDTDRHRLVVRVPDGLRL